jgi:hypothetical protein
MSGTHNKNLLFYSLYPNDQISRQCLMELEKLPQLKKQFIMLCIHDVRNIKKPPAINLPKIVYKYKEKGLIPFIAVAGFDKPVLAGAALSWIKETALKKSDIMPSNIHGQGVSDNCSTIEQAGMMGNTLFDTDYNIGFGSGKGEFSKKYASIDEACESTIVTYDDINDRKTAADEIKNRLEKLKFSRETEVPRAIQRIGGTGSMDGQLPMMGGQPQGSRAMMPQMGGRGQPPMMMPQMGSRGQPPMMMPQMGSRGQPPMMMPQMGGRGQPPMMPQMGSRVSRGQPSSKKKNPNRKRR